MTLIDNLIANMNCIRFLCPLISRINPLIILCDHIVCNHQNELTESVETISILLLFVQLRASLYEPSNWADSITGRNSVVCSYEKFQPSQLGSVNSRNPTKMVEHKLVLFATAWTVIGFWTLVTLLINSSYCVIVRVSVVLKRTVVGD